MKLKLTLAAVLAMLLLGVWGIAVMAEEDVPAPYAGMKNPFPWDDTPAREAGKKLYQQSCLGCHGANGESIPGSDFSTADYSGKLEAQADRVFWIFSEGRMDKGMPPFKSSLSTEKRWQVMTYLWALGQEAPPPETPAPAKPVVEGAVLGVTATGHSKLGETVTLTATLRDSQNQPIKNALVKFFLKTDFFARGLMEIGETLTSEEGIATLEYVHRKASEKELVVRYQTIEARTTLTVTGVEQPFYRAEAGIHLPSAGGEVFIGPESSRKLGEMGEAPETALRLPGGIVSWLWLPVAGVLLIWATYLRVIYRVWRVSAAARSGETNVRLIPLLGMAVVIAFGVLLVLMIITGPYSHFHLLHVAE